MGRCSAMALAVLALAVPARATRWSDPTFEDMVEHAEPIAVVEIVEGGPFAATAKALEVLKGESPGPSFVLCGYNNPWWPPDAVKKESMAKGERYLAFLSPRELGKGEKKPDGPSKGWATPTPSTGDYPIRDGKLHGGWLRTSYPHFAPGIDAGLAISLVRGCVEQLQKRTPTDALRRLAQGLTVAAAAAVTDAKDSDNQARAHTLQWLLCAQAAYGEEAAAPAVLAAAKCPRALVKRCAARALRSCDTSDAVRAELGRLLDFGDSFVQAEAARTLILRPFTREQAVPLLVAALPGDATAGGPSGLMDPLLNTAASGREMMVRALTHFAAWDEAHDELVRLIRDEGLNEGVFDALRAHFLAFPSVAARRRFLELYGRCPEAALGLFHGYLLAERSPESLRAVGDRILGGEMGSSSRQEALVGFAAAVPAGDPRLAGVVLGLLAKYRGTDDALWVLPAAIPAAFERIRKAVNNYPEAGLKQDGLATLELVRRAVALKLGPPDDPKAHVDAWLELADPEKRQSEARPYLLRELARATPAPLRAYVRDSLRARLKAPEAVREAFVRDSMEVIEPKERPRGPFLGIPDNEERRLAPLPAPPGGRTAIVTAVEPAGHRDYLAIKRADRLFAEEYRDGYVHYATRQTVEMGVEGAQRPGQVSVRLTKRFRAWIPRNE